MRKRARFAILFTVVFMAALIKAVMPRGPQPAPTAQDAWEPVYVGPAETNNRWAKMTDHQMDAYLDSLLDQKTRQAVRDLDRVIAAAQ